MKPTKPLCKAEPGLLVPFPFNKFFRLAPEPFAGCRDWLTHFRNKIFARHASP
jgi:hypothetical protein